MFDHYQLRVRPQNMIQEIMEIKANPELIYVFDDLFPESVLKLIQDYDFQSLNWEFRKGSTEWHVFRPENHIRPNFLILTKKYIEKKLRTMSPSTTISAVGFEFLFHSWHENTVGQGVHFDAIETGPLWSAVIHVKGEGGNTAFYEDFKSEKLLKEVEFKPGRVVLFPSMYPHRGMLPPSGDRYSLNSILKISDFDATERILEFSPVLKAKYQNKMFK